MSKRKTIGVIIICDHCGDTYENTNGFVSYNGDEDGSMIWMDAENSGWVEINGNHFCPDCYTIDDNGNYRIKDGRVYDWDTHVLLEGGPQ